MKPWTIAAILAAVVILPMVMRKRKYSLPPKSTDPGARYNIDELIADQEL